jgi:hypothetical protein
MKLNELVQELVPEAIEVLRTILHNEAASPSVHLRAALAILKLANTAEQQSEPLPEPTSQICTTVPELAKPHNSAQQPIRRLAEPGRNSQCPCGSNLKYKRCCANKPATPIAAQVAA